MESNSSRDDLVVLGRGVPARWAALWVAPVIICHRGVFSRNVEQVLSDDRLFSLLALPIVSVLLLWLHANRAYRVQSERRKIAGTVAGLGTISGVLGATLFRGEWGQTAQWLVVVVSLGAGFAFCYGWNNVRAKISAFCLFALSAPPPEAAISAVEAFLQSGSASIAEYVFRLLGMSYLRQGMVFSLPGIAVEVARECSGVRSAIGLFVTAFVFGQIVMRTNVSRVALCVWAVPAAILKNAIRIAVLATLGVWVSPEILRGPLHRYGGPLFLIVAILVFAPVVFLLRKHERVAAGIPARTGED